MRYANALVRARFLRRYKRFLADFELDGQLVTAHCANPGSMLSCLQERAPAWLSYHENPKRKLCYTWEIATSGKSRIQVNPLRANALTQEAIEKGWIPELAGYPTLRREVAYGEASRVDLLLERRNERCYVEVKNATLYLGSGRAAFPDAVTARGARHLEELARMCNMGHRAVMLFAVGRTDADSVEPAVHIDPHYAERLAWAERQGVELLAYTGPIGPREVRLDRRVPVLLD